MKCLRVITCYILVLGVGIPYAVAGDETCEGDAKDKDSWRREGSPDEWKDQEIREMITTVMMVRMSRELELSDEQTVLMVRNFSDLRDTLTELGEERKQLINTMRDKVKSDAPDGEIEPLLDELMAIDDKREVARHEAFENAGADLSVSQRAKLYIFIQDFEWHMRRLIHKAREIGGDRVKRWHDSVVNGDREHDHPEDSPEKETEKPSAADKD